MKFLFFYKNPIKYLIMGISISIILLFILGNYNFIIYEPYTGNSLKQLIQNKDDVNQFSSDYSNIMKSYNQHYDKLYQNRIINNNVYSSNTDNFTNLIEALTNGNTNFNTLGTSNLHINANRMNTMMYNINKELLDKNNLSNPNS